MTEHETLAAVIVEAVKAATAPLVARCLALEAQVTAIEARALVPGPAGRDGIDGVDGRDGKDITAELVTAVVDVAVQKAVSALNAAREPDLSPDEIAATLTELFRKELPLEPVRLQKRVVYDAQGRASHLVEEPAP